MAVPKTFAAAVPIPLAAEQPQGQSVAKLSDVAYARIVAGITSGAYPVDSKLPTEKSLAEQLGVSRPVVREALARLRDNNMVLSRRGSGTYVSRTPEPADRGIAPLSSIADMRRCLEYRISLEGEIAWRAARVRLRGVVDTLVVARDRLVEQMARHELGVEEDFAFHQAIAAATGNRFFVGALTDLRGSVVTGMTITRNFGLLGTREKLVALHDEHLAIFTAIDAADADGARAAMRHHLENAMRRAFDGTEA